MQFSRVIGPARSDDGLNLSNRPRTSGLNRKLSVFAIIMADNIGLLCINSFIMLKRIKLFKAFNQIRLTGLHFGFPWLDLTLIDSIGPGEAHRLTGVVVQYIYSSQIDCT